MTPARTNLFDRLVGWSLANRLFVLAAALALLVAGAFGLQRLPVDVFPDLDKPTVTLMTEAGGMAPEEVEQLVSFPLETAMNGMPGVTRVRSVVELGQRGVQAFVLQVRVLALGDHLGRLGVGVGQIGDGGRSAPRRRPGRLRGPRRRPTGGFPSRGLLRV